MCQSRKKRFTGNGPSNSGASKNPIPFEEKKNATPKGVFRKNLLFMERGTVANLFKPHSATKPKNTKPRLGKSIEGYFKNQGKII